MRELVELGKSDMEFVGSRMRCGADRRAGNDTLPRKSCRLRRPRSLDRCLEGIHVPTIVHLCYGYPGGGGQHEYEYPDLLKELMKTRIGGFAVEFARSNYDPQSSGDLPGTFGDVRLRGSRRLACALCRRRRRARPAGAQVCQPGKPAARSRLRPDDHQSTTRRCQSKSAGRSRPRTPPQPLKQAESSKAESQIVVITLIESN